MWPDRVSNHRCLPWTLNNNTTATTIFIELLSFFHILYFELVGGHMQSTFFYQGCIRAELIPHSSSARTDKPNMAINRNMKHTRE